MKTRYKDVRVGMTILDCQVWVEVEGIRLVSQETILFKVRRPDGNCSTIRRRGYVPVEVKGVEA